VNVCVCVFACASMCVLVRVHLCVGKEGRICQTQAPLCMCMCVRTVCVRTRVHID
jgi:hypothetical protein